MKFMKLGSKPDAFLAQGNSIRYESSELETDVTVSIGEVKFHLHKFPLLSKSNLMQKLVLKASEENSDEINLFDFPGGTKAFEICAKFCYGITATISPYNVVAARCAAEYLEMTEEMDHGNLIYKIEVFLNSSVFRSWKDSIIVLQSTRSLLPWSEDLKVVGRCIDSIASKTSTDPSGVNWSYTYNRRLAVADIVTKIGMKFPENNDSVPKDWWVEDICELEMELYKRVMIAIKSKGRMNGNVIGEALKTYAIRWLPDSVDALVSAVHNKRNKSLVETIICLLPSDKGVACSCSFLLKLLKVSILIGADDSSRNDLIEGISLKLHEATVNDLLIPAQSTQRTIYDFELVQCLVNMFVMNGKCCWDSDVEKNGKSAGAFRLEHGSWLNVGKLIDGYLAKVAHDPNLSHSSFIDLSQSIPESARPIHDGLYGAIDIYLKEHPSLTKGERKKVCGLIDVKKLSIEASMHAAQNELLPLRVVVQVLFFEQVRAAAGVQTLVNTQDALHSSIDHKEVWEMTVPVPVPVPVPGHPKSLGKQLTEMKLKDEDLSKSSKLIKNGSRRSGSAQQLLPSRSRRIFDKLWIVGKGHGLGENKNSETSGSSQSPTTMIPGETKSSHSLSRHRRYSIS